MDLTFGLPRQLKAKPRFLIYDFLFLFNSSVNPSRNVTRYTIQNQSELDFYPSRSLKVKPRVDIGSLHMISH